MKNIADEAANSIINVIDEFDCSTQNNSYNDKFLKWRRKKDNPFSFSFEMNIKEKIFIDGKGFVNTSAADAEKNTLSRIFYVIGSAMLIWVTIDDVVRKLAVQILSIIGADVHNNFFSSVIYGGRKEIVSVLICMSLMKIIIPAIYTHKKFRVPAKVEFMSNMNDPWGLLSAIALTLIVCAVTSIPSAYSNDTKEIYAFFKSLDTDVHVWGQTEFVVYTVFEILVMPIISELFFRGAMFAVLRQFGDPFAIIMTSVTAGLLIQDCREMPAIILMSLVTSFGMLRSGTIFTAMSASVLYKMYQLGLAIIEVDPSKDMFITRGMFMAGTFLAGAALSILVWIFHSRKKNHGLAMYNSELNMKNRILHCIKVFPYSAVAAICLVYALIRFIFD